MEYGLVLANSAVPAGLTSAEALLNLAEVADSADGWDNVWVGDSLLAVPRLESVVLLAACASRTKRVRLGVGCQVSLGFRHPLIFAIQWASLDVLSGGRMLLVACGGRPRGPGIEDELTAFGMDFPAKIERMEEAMALLRLCSTREKVDYHGKYVSVTEFTLSPAFIQHPLPIWMAANPSANSRLAAVERVLGRVARLADGWITFGLAPQLIAQRIAIIRRLREAQESMDARAFPVCVYLDINVGLDRDAPFEDALITSRQEGRASASAERLKASAAVGSVDDCAAFVRRLADAGATTVAFRPVTQHPLSQVETITEHLLPRLRAQVG
jgi:alkanesulfonate monooxygenase SsuD/methylene tetrahydromethanopterin reductase-like flavin-dependent oxidoreductase (luciferase family)